MINYTALQIKDLTKFDTEIWYEKHARGDIILINEDEKLAMIFEFKYNGSAEEA